MKGKTYSLFGQGTDSQKYYADVRTLLAELLDTFPDEKTLLLNIQQMSMKWKRGTDVRGISSKKRVDKALQKQILHEIKTKLSSYTMGVKDHLKGLSITERFDPIISTREYQYHLYMLEIELANKIYKTAFRESKYKFALIAHCLRDFRPKCSAESGEIEDICKACTKECFIHLGSLLLKKYNIDPYISIEMEQKKLFKKLKEKHPSIGALGIACIPMLSQGMRLCTGLGIPAVGIPLDANRCSLWMGKAHENSFSLKELETLLAP